MAQAGGNSLQPFQPHQTGRRANGYDRVFRFRECTVVYTAHSAVAADYGTVLLEPSPVNATRVGRTFLSADFESGLKVQSQLEGQKGRTERPPHISYGETYLFVGFTVSALAE